MLPFFPRGVLDGILNLIESVSQGFPSYSFIGQPLGTSRVVHLPKRTVMVLFTICLYTHLSLHCGHVQLCDMSVSNSPVTPVHNGTTCVDMVYVL